MAKSPLNDDQAEHIAAGLLDSQSNVSTLVARLLGRPLRTEELDPTFDHVCAVGEIFKCEECGTWCMLCDRAPDWDNRCIECEDTD